MCVPCVHNQLLGSAICLDSRNAIRQMSPFITARGKSGASRGQCLALSKDWQFYRPT